jgi:hypothetical protein
MTDSFKRVMDSIRDKSIEEIQKELDGITDMSQELKDTLYYVLVEDR